jgi:hypothetical protein
MVVSWPGKKNPRTDYLDPGITLFILKIYESTFVLEGKTAIRAGLLISPPLQRPSHPAPGFSAIRLMEILDKYNY